MFHFIKYLRKYRNFINIFLGNPGLEKYSCEALTKRLLCQYHFDDACFVNPILKNRLKPTAVPIHFDQRSVAQTMYHITQNESVLIPKNTYGKTHQTALVEVNVSNDEIRCSSSESDTYIQSLINLPSSPAKKHQNPTISIHDNSNKIRKQKLLIEKLQRLLQLKNKKIAVQSSHIAKLKIAIRKIRTSQKFDSGLMSKEFFMKWSRTIVRMQLRKKRQWFPDEKKFALILHYKSPNAYKYLTRMISLPSVSTVRHWH